MSRRFILPVFILCLVISSILSAQTFTKITTTVMAADSFPRGYPGTAWIDYNNDGLLDLFVNNDYLYKNDGGGNFSKNLTFKGRTQPLTPPTVAGSGSSWADYNNDGYIDMFSASAKSFLFKNNGDETFTRIETGILADSLNNRGWSCAWGDYDNDGNVDLLIVHPAGFVPGTPLPCQLFHNDGPPDYNFTKVTSFEFTKITAPYTVATWSDYDMDGDLDLFIASGPANGTPARDYLYKNMLKETGTATFERINDSPIGTDLQDGQVWNWIDFDNDGDLDAFVTNYGAAPNRFYRNDNGVFTSITTGMELDGLSCLANAWGDFDNDGYLDVIITSETKNFFFHNNGDGTFQSVTNAITTSDRERGVSIGDYDNDGDLDVFIAGFPNARGLFRNDNDNGNNWKKFQLVGTLSNKSAIGAKVKLKCVINGTPMWQLREVSAQNSFNSQNSLIVHFGLNKAAAIDSVIIDWPSGKRQVLTNVQINTMETITEPTTTGVNDVGQSPKKFYLNQNYPNPFNPSTTLQFSIPSTGFVSLKVYDLMGTEVASLINGLMPEGEHKVSFDASTLASGVYFYTLKSNTSIQTKKMILLR